jgi:hypothetical protein
MEKERAKTQTMLQWRVLMERSPRRWDQSVTRERSDDHRKWRLPVSPRLNGGRLRSRLVRMRGRRRYSFAGKDCCE